MARTETFEQLRERQATDYEEWRRNRERHAQAVYNAQAAQEIDRLRRAARTAKAEYDGHVEYLTSRIVTLTKAIEVAEERLAHVSKRERIRHAAEQETAKRIANVEKSMAIVAKDALVTKVEKAVEAKKIKRKVIRRDKQNRIVAVDEVEVEI